VYFGRIEAEKGIFELLELWKMNPQLPTLHIIGNGTRLREVRLISKSLRNIVIHGAKYGEELEQILHISKVAIFPALWKEPFGRTIGESLARGQAVAISNNIQQKNIVSEGINGSIFEIAETEILGAVMKCLSLDVNKHIQISQKKWEESCSPAAVSNSWKNLYPILQNK
jgi:glycosyltransferase involved in cell wall biosynthesis